ncbi:MAG: phage protease [Vicinamibacterales bacterium]
MTDTRILNHVLLSWPSVVTLQAGEKGSSRRSWIQLAKTGSFVSTRYGTFSITRDDLSTMLHNYSNITPAAPTELPIDYDHLSMDPKKPGDGIAAGWMKKLELREHGDELWCEVEWTPDAAKQIEHGEYRFVSPSFVKNHKHKDGTQIGTTLLAAAITNHPFLEGMAALTLANDPVFGGLAVLDEVASRSTKEITMEVGQRVMIAPGQARTQDEIGGTFEITEVVGDGANAFVTIKDANGVPHKWFRATELLPASATPANPIQPNLQPAPGTPAPGAPKANTPGGIPAAKAHPMPQDTDIEQKAAAFLRRLPKDYKAADVIDLSRQYPDEGEAYRLHGVGAEIVNDAPAPISLSTHSGKTFDQLVQRDVLETGKSWRQAAHDQGMAHPDLAAAR